MTTEVENLQQAKIIDRSRTPMSSENAVDEFVRRGYRHGFVTDIESESAPPGLDENTVRWISARKNEPEWLLEWRLKALKYWHKMREPNWAHLKLTPIEFQKISYFSAPKSDKDRPQSLDEVDPKLLETYEKLGVPLHERARLAGVAVDAVRCVDPVEVQGINDRAQLASAERALQRRRAAALLALRADAVDRRARPRRVGSVMRGRPASAVPAGTG